MATIILPTMLRSFAGRNEEISAPGATVEEVLSNIMQQYPELEKQMLVGGRLRSYFRIFMGKQNIHYMNGLETPVDDKTVLRVIPAIGGGCGA
ncbi:MAG: MoaD/ThiS family protein [Anaerolineae bacterium]|nr:MoaD/ThiS family protein [Anaerolineae bacterium]